VKHFFRTNGAFVCLAQGNVLRVLRATLPPWARQTAGPLARKTKGKTNDSNRKQMLHSVARWGVSTGNTRYSQAASACSHNSKDPPAGGRNMNCRWRDGLSI
jgi:hypothetical protein